MSLNTTTKSNQKVVKSSQQQKKGKKQLKYPIFLECTQYIIDEPFWVSIFENLAYGKAPSGTYLSKGGFFCGVHKGNGFSLCLETYENRIEDLTKDVLTLLTQKVGVQSAQDNIRSLEAMDSAEQNIQSSRTSWLDIKKKSVKDVMIDVYVLEQAKKYNLSISDAKNLNSLLNIAMVFKTILPKDITFQNGKITAIQGISFDEKNHSFIFAHNLIPGGEGKKTDLATVFNGDITTSPEPKMLSDAWKKYISNL